MVFVIVSVWSLMAFADIELLRRFWKEGTWVPYGASGDAPGIGRFRPGRRFALGVDMRVEADLRFLAKAMSVRTISY